MEIDLVSDDGVTIDVLKLSEIDAIAAQNFDSMINEAFSEGKHFFVARIKSRQAKEQGKEQVDHNHYFNAYSILKLIFKRRGTEYVGRFHDRYPITVKNPITNLVSLFSLKLSRELSMKFIFS